MDSLSKRLNITINDFQIILNQELNEKELNEHNLTKVGFIGRIFIKAKRSENVFFSKNCELKCLTGNNGIIISPILDSKVGATIMYGTSSYLWYKHNRLSKFVFQIIQNKYAAQKHLKDFENKLLASVGNPDTSTPPLVIWDMDNQRIVLEYPKNEHGYIHMMIRE